MKIALRMNMISMKTWMTATFLAVALLSILLLTVVTNHTYGEEIKKNFFGLSNEVAASVNSQMDLYFSHILQSTNSLIRQDNLQTWLSAKGQSSATEDDNISLLMQRYVAFNHPEIIGMFLLSNDGRIVPMGAGFQPTLEPYSHEPWFLIPPAEKVTILPTHITNYPQQTGIPVISLIVPIYSIENVELQGKLVIDLTLSAIAPFFNVQAVGQAGEVMLIANDHVVFHPVKKFQGVDVSQTDLAGVTLPKRGQAEVAQVQGVKSLISVKQSVSTGWDVVLRVPYDQMSGGLQAAQKQILVIVIALIGIIGILVPILTGLFIRPVLHLKHVMQQVALGNWEGRSQTKSGLPEFRQLNYSFNSMVEQLNTLRLQEMNLRLSQKEALIKALQNQINPHFLYNSLDIIKSIAYLEGVPQVEAMAVHLANVYRYTTKAETLNSTVKEELANLADYLAIIHVRFPKHFQSRIYVHEKYYDCEMIRLVLQPIVENAVKYAIEPKGGRGMIAVSAYVENKDLVIEIADNGSGMSDPKVKELNGKLMDLSQNAAQETIPHGSLGLANVHARLVLHYGESYGIKVHSFPERGTIVWVRVPFQRTGS
ncbi:hypothetical protein A8709_05260 [Paenibacillus pectinilyticus]|uniref:histidine kinase n=1 Tax=Paenibacillus pectinilyticus TaxID=512399 RepID=A0A1C0ZSQ3_9BACL|nr:histidine kinase [Paenibacillus pectinilyticus]OCT11101.1 hypothetical protein A8709_05260 [Paenibacillus pectinilyticus]